MKLRTLVRSGLAVMVVAILTGGVYEPAPAPPGYYAPGYYSYGYAPGYYRPEPQVALGFRVGDDWNEHHHHHWR
jgi:hypothetical protein